MLNKKDISPDFGNPENNTFFPPKILSDVEPTNEYISILDSMLPIKNNSYNPRLVESVPDLIYLDNGVTLPEGMTTTDLQDAMDQARRFVGQHISLVVFVRDRLERDGIILGGHSLGDGRIIELSVANARLNTALPSDLPGFEPAPAHHQLWATTFEEAMHSARKAAGKDQGPYFMVPPNPTEDDIQRYLTQETEKVVDDALNSGILAARIGVIALYYRKRVLVAPNIQNMLSGMTEMVNAIGSKINSNSSPHKKISNLNVNVQDLTKPCHSERSEESV